MNKDGGILRIRTKEGRILRIALPDEICRNGISPLFLRNLATIASNRSGRSRADGRATHRYRRLYLRGVPLNKLLPLAAKRLDKRDFEVLTRSCVREMNEKRPNIAWPDIDAAICYLDDAGTLAHCSAREAAERVTAFLQRHGLNHNLSSDVYRKRRERLQRIGVKLGPDK
jgi:hypothetical protein